MVQKSGPGDPAAHRLAFLPLLPSGPGGVCRILLHRAQPLLIFINAFHLYIMVFRSPSTTKIGQPAEALAKAGGEGGIQSRPNVGSFVLPPGGQPPRASASLRLPHEGGKPPSIPPVRIFPSILSRTKAGGEGGIRTHGTVASTRALQARRFDRSRTSPYR